MAGQLFVVADRGKLKAFRPHAVVENRPPSLELVKSITLEDALLKPSERYSDGLSGRQEQNGAGGQQAVQQNSSAEKHFELEETRRLIKHLSETITEILEQEHPKTWSFAAPAEIHESILAGLNPDLGAGSCKKVPRDLVNNPVNDLLSHF